MTARAAPRVPRETHTKKASEKPVKKDRKIKDTLYAVSEHSLSGFLDNEPDIYSVTDLKVRYR
jgi:hypothetical protein